MGITILSWASAKIWGWAVTRRKCSTIPEQGPTLDAKLAEMGLNRLASSVCPCLVEASPTVETAVLCYKTDWLVASLLSFLSVQSSPAVREGGTLRTRPRTGVCEPDVVASKAHQSYVSSADLPSDSLRENPENHKTVKSGGWALARIWVLVWVVKVKPAGSYLFFLGPVLTWVSRVIWIFIFGPSSYYRYLYTKYARYTLGGIVCMVFRSCLWCNG